ncbi:hypothetical protein L2E82_23090 [Cichorium intybus]|uniref:Uncharacterized protein n=1 Tax=Cichorium intybus TaxID=13427 RepID=A0ACB9E0L0_CICIN|nr:hypothetical protein L2E82_23090 [Cichorium intybus]
MLHKLLLSSRLEHWNIGTLEYRGVAKGLYVTSPSGKPTLSRVHLLKRNVKYYRIVVQIKHFAEDEYNKPANPVLGKSGYHLHAHQLVLCHPMTNEVSSFLLSHGHTFLISVTIKTILKN